MKEAIMLIIIVLAHLDTEAVSEHTMQFTSCPQFCRHLRLNIVVIIFLHHCTVQFLSYHYYGSFMKCS